MDWTAEAIEALRALWAEGHSTAEIGRRMGISKNAVVGKAHRLNLPARPSPIRRENEPRATAAPAAAPVAPAMAEPVAELPVPPLSAPAAAPPAPEPEPVRPALTTLPPATQPIAPAAALAAPRPPAATRRPAPPAVVRPFQRMGGRSCCWPIGEPGTPDFRFCTGEAIPGKPYCPEHAAVAYVKARDRRDDAA